MNIQPSLTQSHVEVNLYDVGSTVDHKRSAFIIKVTDLKIIKWTKIQNVFVHLKMIAR